MNDDSTARLDKRRPDQISSELLQIKILLAVLIVLVLASISGPWVFFEAIGALVFGGGLCLAGVYLILLLLQKLLDWKHGPNNDAELAEKILQEFESEVDRKS